MPNIPLLLLLPLLAIMHPVVSLAAESDARSANALALSELTGGPGSRVSGFLTVPGVAGPSGRIPVTVVRGMGPGPTLALVAGVHGYEYAPMLALHRLRETLDPAELAGAVILVHVANAGSFHGRTIYRHPEDHKNLNRVYPGDPAGTVSQRVAAVLTTQVIAQADYLIDLHAGDGNENLPPYLYAPLTGRADVDRRTLGLARAFGLDKVVLHDVGDLTPESSRYTDATAVLRGIPAITTETGQLGETDARWVDAAFDGIQGVLRHLAMLPGEAEVAPEITWLSDFEVLTAPAAGFFEAKLAAGQLVEQGTLLGVLRDLFGEPVHEVRAPFAGYLNYIIATPPMSAGEPMAMISHVVAAPHE